MREIAVDITGLGFILYSPPAVKHIQEGSDYLQKHFWTPEDVARHVMNGQLTSFCTGTPGSFRLRFREGVRDEQAVDESDFKLRLALEVRDGVVCVQDLYDLMWWAPPCPGPQQVIVDNGWYRLTVYSFRPKSGILGDNQNIDIHLEPMPEKPKLHWEGVPCLCD